MNVAVHPEHLNILSICTGGAGLDLGFELAIPDARTVCMVEREGFAVAQLVSAMEAGLLAPAPIWSDARTFDGRAWRGAVDGLIGGIPCQPHSLAGKRLGEEDERDLWSTARRIIVQSRVWIVLIENVGGMLSAGNDEIAGAERVFRDLLKLGFAVEGGLFTAREVCSPHERPRIFILAVADAGSEGLEGCERVGPSQQRYGKAASRSASEFCGTLFPPGPDNLSAWSEIVDRSPELEPAFRRVADGLASRLDIARVDRLRMLGNGVVCLEAAYAVRTLSTRLARRGSVGAAKLVRMMDGVAA